MSKKMGFNPTRLIAARKRRAMTRHGLADALGLPSVVPLGKIEGAKRVPDDDLVKEFARVLGFPVGFFYAPDLPELTSEMILP